MIHRAWNWSTALLSGFVCAVVVLGLAGLLAISPGSAPRLSRVAVPAAAPATYNYDDRAQVATAAHELPRVMHAGTTPSSNLRVLTLATSTGGAERSGVSLRPIALGRAAKAEESGARAFVGRRGAAKTFDDGSSARYGGEINIPRGTNAAGEVNGVQYSGHAFDQMQGRGITPTAVEDALANAGTPGRAGTIIHYSPANDLSVVTGRGGRVVTVGYGRFH